ncbi:YdiU family protein [Ectothiorhodospiraceae bacterium WFHF3C12]|nr:YdiU family protein [Ectothiorhodospiraceae bacterium WFHF3C12]
MGHARKTIDPVARFGALRFEDRWDGLPDSLRSRVEPTPLPDAELVDFSPATAEAINLDPAAAADPELPAFLAGQRLPQGAAPTATAYAGHQFGNFVPQLGDGRAISLGQVSDRFGQPWDLQLKGCGRTPYSRWADGRAVLRSTIREHLCSEAMAGLGIPTTRSLGLVVSSERIQRETLEPGAALLRAAPSHIRFGHYEYVFYRQEYELLKPLADYVITQHFPHLRGHRAPYRQWLTEVMELTAWLVAQWQAVGFVHAVLNTDNMSILGLTIDYGPFAFMDAYDPKFTPNHSDPAGRYAYENQPLAAEWNFSRLLQATLPLLSDDPEEAVEIGTHILDRFQPEYQRQYNSQMRAKLGLKTADREDESLMDDLLERMAASGADFTRSFRALCQVSRDGRGDDFFLDEFADRDAASSWLAAYRQRLEAEPADDRARQLEMCRANPAYVLRTHLAQAAIEQATAGDYTEVERLRRLLERPFDEQPDMAGYAALPPDWAQGIELSCSS